MNKNYLISVLYVFCLLATSFTNASTIIGVDLNQVLQESELVFEGRVIHQESRISPVNGDPFTYFTLEIIDIIKGSTTSNQIELGFMGGPKGDLVLYVTDMVMPKMGERGIYFVESLIRQQVHPLYGWAQGHYLVIPDSVTGQERVVPLISKPNALISAPSVEEFKNTLRDMLVNGQ